MTLESTKLNPEQERRQQLSNDEGLGSANFADMRRINANNSNQTDDTILPKVDLFDSEKSKPSIGVTGDGKPYRIFRADDSITVLEQRGGWFYGSDTGENSGQLKVHVTTSDASDLQAVQAVLIPALENDPELKNLVVVYKTIDPQFGVDGNGQGAKPTGNKQGAKGFTIYTRSAEDAAAVQTRVDQILSENGLGLDRQINSGNVDQVYGESQRVGLTRDHWYEGNTANGIPGAVIDKSVEDAIKRTIHADPDRDLSPDELREAEKYSGIRANTLDYSKDHQLIYTGMSRDVDSAGLYATEVGTTNKPGSRTGRPALYALYRTFGVDPNLAAIETEKKDQITVNGTPTVIDAQGITIGRKDVTADPDLKSKVSREHAKIFRGPDGKIYINDRSSNGTWVNGKQIEPGVNVPITPEDTINLGGPSGPTLNDKKPDVEVLRGINEPTPGPDGEPLGRGIIWDPAPEPIGPNILITPKPEPAPRGIFDPVPEPAGPNILITPKPDPLPRGTFDPIPEPFVPGTIIAAKPIAASPLFKP